MERYRLRHESVGWPRGGKGFGGFGAAAGFWWGRSD
jgi:hypothetical protein